MQAIRIQNRTTKIRLITLARHRWINIHHLGVRHILRNARVSMVYHSLWIWVAKKNGREGARGEGIWARMWC